MRITTTVVSSNPADNGVYSIQQYVIQFVSDLRQVGGFFPGTPVSSTNKTDRHDITEIFLKNVVKHHKPNHQILISFELNKTLYCMFRTGVQFDASYRSGTEYRLLGTSCFILVLFVFLISFFTMFRNVF